jgi:hypothetical protein
MKKLALIFFALCITVSSWASDFTSNGISYTITSSKAPYTVEVAYGGYSGSITIPATVTNGTTTYSVVAIGDDAFVTYMATSQLTSVTIPSSVTSIGSDAFSNCSQLTSINIPTSVISIGRRAFGGCTGLTSISIPAAVRNIGTEAFIGCSNLTAITVDDSNTIYASIDGVLFNKAKTTLISFPAKKSNNYSIPSSVTTIDRSAFYGCSGLTSVTIPSSVTSINREAFSYCSGLTSISFPSSIKSIGSLSFSGCSGITELTIPSSVTQIGGNAFLNCSGITSIYAYPTTPVSVNDSDSFYGLYKSTCVLHVPKNSLTAYETASIWKDFVNIVGDLTSGVANATASTVKATVTNGQLLLSGATEGEAIKIYNLQGATVYSGKVSGSALSIPLPTRGVYVVQVGNLSIKVIY